MRLLIAGILTLVIYLLTCAYGENRENTSKVEQIIPSECHFQPQSYRTVPYFDFFYQKLFPGCLRHGYSNLIETQTFPNV